MSVVMDDIKYFVVVSETSNVTRASEILGISQPALSYAIKRLERELGGELLIRLKSGIRLTKMGEEFLKRSRRLIYEWEQAQNVVDPDSVLAEGRYTFAIHPSVALYSLKKFLPVLSDAFPMLDFYFIHGLSREMTERVVSWEADFGIVVNPIKHPDLVIKKLCADIVTIFYKQGAKNKLIYDPSLSQSQFVLKKFKHSLINLEGEICSRNLEVISNLTSLGVGYGILPSRVAAQYKSLKQLSNAPIFKDEICLIYRPERHHNKISQKIIQILKKSKI